MAQLFSLSGQTLVDGNGTPYAGAKASFFETGTTTPKATYSNASLVSANANPVVANADGRFGDIYLVAGRYKVVLATSADVAIDTLDPVDATSQLIAQSSAPGTTYPFLRYHNTTDGNVYRRNAANSAWINEGPVDSLISGATVSEVLTGTATDKAVTPDSLAGLWQRGADVASASTLSLPAGGGGVFNVTGTTGITGISSAQGGRRVLLRFAAGCVLTHNGTSFILFGSNITTAAGDVAEFVNDAAQDASGSNWRCVNYQFFSGVPSPSPTASSKTGNYTVLDSDRGGTIRFAGLSGDATLTLPAASGRAGFVLHLSNEDTNEATGYGVIVDPNSTELIDGLSTRKGYTGTRVTLVCDGTGWRTVGGYWRYYSGNQTFTASGSLTLAHALGVRPRRVWTELVCTTAEFNYSIGFVIHPHMHETNAAGHNGLAVVSDATNLSVRFAANFWAYLNFTTAASVNLTAANWRVRFYAED